MELDQLAKSKANCKFCGEWSHKLGLSTRGRMASTGLGCALTWAKNHYHPSLRWLQTLFGWLRYGEKMHFWMSDPLWIICKPIFSVTKMWNFTTFKNTAPKDFEQVFKQEPRSLANAIFVVASSRYFKTDDELVHGCSYFATPLLRHREIVHIAYLLIVGVPLYPSLHPWKHTNRKNKNKNCFCLIYSICKYLFTKKHLVDNNMWLRIDSLQDPATNG